MPGIKKIAKVITFCNECEYCLTTQEQRGNTFFALICVHAHNAIDEEPEQDIFLIGTSSEDPKHCNWHIPKQCPLEDYKENA